MAKEQKKGKRFLPWLMVLSMMLSLAPVNAFAEESNDSIAESYCPDSESSDESSDNSSEVSESNDAAEESSEDETTDAPKETEAASKDETDTAFDAAFSFEAKEEAPEESISTGSAVSEKAVVFAAESAAPPAEDVTTYYPVYVYACFANNGTLLNRGNNHPAAVVTDGVKQELSWNEDASRGWYYITFGEVEKGTTVVPVKGASTEFTGDLSKMDDFTGIGNAKDNGFKWSDVTRWGNLGGNDGATGFPNAGYSWHLDGDIRVYTVAYANGLDEASEETVADIPEKDTNYYLGTYTVSTAVPTREGYTFDGWTLDGTKVGETIDLSKISNKTAAEVTLTAQWKENAKPEELEQPAKKHHHSDTEDTVPVNPEVEIKDDEAMGLNQTDHYAYIVGYGNGEVRPQNSITRAEVASIFFRLLEDDVRNANYTRENSFTDVSSDAWYCSAVSTLSAMGILSGYPDATFRPNAFITRAEFAAIATRFDADSDKTPAPFDDIANHWAKDEIAVATNNDWVNGYEDGSFCPQNNITRAETMSLVNRVLNRNPETAEDLLSDMITFTDNADTNAWYYLAVQEATNSHYNTSKENSAYEKWTGLRKTLD